MRWDRRLGTGILGGLGFFLLSLMLYVLFFEHLNEWSKVDPRRIEAVDVSVFVLERSEWRIFRQGLNTVLSEPRRIGRILAEEEDLVVVETMAFRQCVRFTWVDARGEGETKAEVHRLVTGQHPPVAVIGSSNSVLTQALAEQLQSDFASGKADGPVLLVPWATSVRLLEIYPNRTFRFCSSNRRAAEQLVGCIASRTSSRPPARATILVDDRDPYSIDLANCFREAIARRLLKTEVIERRDILSPTIRRRISTNQGTPTTTEAELARSIWADALALPGETTWLILPIQNEPARRMLTAINAASPSTALARRADLSVICGDAVGQTTLESYVHLLSFPVWGLSTVSDLATSVEPQIEDDVQVLAEVAIAVLSVIDAKEVTPGSDFRAGLEALRLGRSDRVTFGRPISFLASGERAWESEENVLLLEPGKDYIAFCERDATGVWSAPKPINTPTEAKNP